MIRQLDHLNLNVSDLAASVRFYGEAFGFETVEQGTHRTAPFRILRAGEAMLCLYERAPVAGDRGGFNHFALRVDDREAAVARLVEAGVAFGYGGRDGTVYPHSHSWYVRDPDGHEIEVVSWNDDRIAFEPRG